MEKRKNNLNKEDDLLIQGYLTIAFLSELNNLNFLHSESYKSLNFQDEFVKSNLPHIGLGNRGSLIISLYALLVLPKELYKKLFFGNQFSKINSTIKRLIKDESSNYNRDNKNCKLKIDYIYHLRNSVAHGKIEFTDHTVIFKDENDRAQPKESCRFEIELVHIGKIISELQLLIISYLKTKK